MNEISVFTKQLPEVIEDVADFVVVNEEKLNAVKAAIRAARKTNDVNLEKLEEQRRELEVTVILAQCKLGELTKDIPKASQNRGNQYSAKVQSSDLAKSEQLNELGITKQRASEYERMAAHPEAVQRVIETEEHPTKAAVMREIQAEVKPHVTNNSGDNEWFTPAEYIEAARSVMGSIDLDPASNDFANQTVKATVYYTEENDGLKQTWSGNIWMNPPYSSGLVKPFVDKLVESDFSQAVVLVNNATETTWFRKLIDKADAVVFPTGRIRFQKDSGTFNTPLQGQAFIYFGERAKPFLEVFGKYGWGAML